MFFTINVVFKKSRRVAILYGVNHSCFFTQVRVCLILNNGMEFVARSFLGKWEENTFINLEQWKTFEVSLRNFKVLSLDQRLALATQPYMTLRMYLQERVWF